MQLLCFYYILYKKGKDKKEMLKKHCMNIYFYYICDDTFINNNIQNLIYEKKTTLNPLYL